MWDKMSYSEILLPPAGQSAQSASLLQEIIRTPTLLITPCSKTKLVCVCVFFLSYLTAEQLVHKKMEEIQNKVDLQQNVEGAYLTHLLLSEEMTVTEILGSITELLLAGVDTVCM